MLQPSTNYGPQIVDALKAKQTELGLNNSDFARHLKINRTTWVLTSQAVRPLPRGVATQAARKFPDLKDLVIAFLLGFTVRRSESRMRIDEVMRTSNDDMPTRELAEATR